jgi:hypothetical protein
MNALQENNDLDHSVELALVTLAEIDQFEPTADATVCHFPSELLDADGWPGEQKPPSID